MPLYMPPEALYGITIACKAAGSYGIAHHVVGIIGEFDLQRPYAVKAVINGFAEVLVVYGYAPVIRFILLIKHRFKIKAEIEGIVGLLYRGGNKLGRVLIAHPFALIKK